MSNILNVSLIQANLQWENIQANLSYFSEKINNLSAETDLIILPEMFTTGFSMNAQKLAETENGNSLHWMKQMAIKKNAAIIGSIIVQEDTNFYNRLYFVYPDGTYKKYDKRHTFTLAKENETYTAGKDKLVLEYKTWKICPLICYDLRFPVWSRNVENYDLLIYVANWPKKRISAWDALLKARAIENMSYCIGVNRVGLDGKGYEYTGHSTVYDSLGNEISNMNEEREFVHTISINKQEQLNLREQLQFLKDRDKFQII